MYREKDGGLKPYDTSWKCFQWFVGMGLVDFTEKGGR